MNRVIVTGANGFIGSALVSNLLSKGINVIAVDLPNCCNKIDTSNAYLKFVGLDLNDIKGLSNILNEEGFDCFYHFAWAGVDTTNRQNIAIQLKNIQWTIDCLKVAKELKCNKFISSGSIMEDETLSACLTDNNRPGLGYVYGASKLCAHLICSSVANDIGIDLIWGKVTNAYGIGEISTRLINTTLRKLIQGESPKFTAAKQNYDFIYIDDVAQAFYLLGERGKPFHCYTIGSGKARPLKEFLLDIQSEIAPNVNFIFGDVPYTGIDLKIEEFSCEKIYRDTGFIPRVTFRDGIRLTYEWLKKMDVEIKL